VRTAGRAAAVHGQLDRVDPEAVPDVEMLTDGGDERPDVVVDRTADGAAQVEVLVGMGAFPADRHRRC
jgi:hypothetical protein